MENNCTFGKNEHLCLKNEIKEVIENGDKTYTETFFVNYAIKQENNNDTKNRVKIAISVKKRFFKKAVDRNLIKRRIREAYRTNKHLLTETATKKNIILNIIIVYVPKEKLPYAEIEKSIVKCIKKLTECVEKKGNISISADN